ncbi:MAG: hypothetical protein WC467_03215 [Patescibacteria group bacterium]
MKKGRLMVLVIIALFLLLAIFIFYKFFSNRQTPPAGYVNLIENPTEMTVPSATVNMPKPIELEFMTPKEKDNFSINTSSVDNIQVLARDKDGNITSYKIIKKESDILKEY